MSTTKPTLVLVHGSWHCPEHFVPLVDVLERRGNRSVSVSLPSTQSPALPPASLANDTAAVREAVLSELDAGHDVIVVAHSYGGAPANNALHGLDAKSRTVAKATTAVVAIVFLCAVPVSVGATFLDTIGGRPAELHDLSKHAGFSVVGGEGPSYYFYNDLATEDQEKYAAMIRPQAWAAYVEKTKYAAYMDSPSWYLLCTKDHAIPLVAQRAIVDMANANGGRIQTETLESSHSPFLSKPQETADFIIRATGAAMAGP